MNKYPGIPELLEQYMEANGLDEQWITVNELRNRFGLTRYQCNTISGFLRRLEFGSFGQFPFIVLRIEHSDSQKPSGPTKCRYLVKRKPGQKKFIPEPDDNKNKPVPHLMN
jgi:hypothetical protein